VNPAACLITGLSLTAMTVGLESWAGGLPPALHLDLVGMGLPASLNSMACSNRSDCVFDAETGLRATLEHTTDGGRIWSPADPVAAIPDTVNIDCVGRTCFSPAVPIHGVQGVLVSTDGGAQWARRAAAAAEWISCSSTVDCVSIDWDVAYDVVVTQNQWRTWRAVSFPVPDRGRLPFIFVSCVRSSECLLAGIGTGRSERLAVLDESDNGGESWHPEVPPTSISNAELSCGSGGCWLAGETNPYLTNGEVLSSRDGGHTWTATTFPSGVGNPDPPTCSSPTVCWMAFSPWPTGPDRYAVTTDGGASWTMTSITGLATAPEILGCPFLDDCLAARSGPDGITIYRLGFGREHARSGEQAPAGISFSPRAARPH
jgi:hypothetical protein